MSGILAQDPRWRRLHEREWTCPCCGLKHAGLFDLAVDQPYGWNDGDEQTESHFLNRNFCVQNGEHYFVRCVLRIPVIGADTEFGFGVWSSLSKKNFDLYSDTFDSDDQSTLGPWFGWFSNRLNSYPDTLGLKCHVHPQAGRHRPLIELEPTDHPLAVEQREGITFDRVLEIYAANGHDMRQALLD